MTIDQNATALYDTGCTATPRRNDTLIIGYYANGEWLACPVEAERAFTSLDALRAYARPLLLARQHTRTAPPPA